MPAFYGKEPRDDWYIGTINQRTSWVDWSWGSNTRRPYGPTGISGPVYVPPVISEEPQTWEELEALEPELFEPILETRPGLPPDPYPQPSGDDFYVPEDDDMAAWDWGTAVSTVIDVLQGQSPGGSPAGYAPPVQLQPPGTGTVLALPSPMSGDCDGVAWSGGVPPKGYKVVNYCGRGVLRKIRRRRRRRMLTASDASDLATIVGIVGKGQMASSMINRTRS